MGKIKESQASQKPLLNSTVTNSQRKIAISIPSAQKVLNFLLLESRNPEMALHFVGKKRIGKLHAEFFEDPSPTDCITFPYEDPNFLGEVFVCPEIASEYIQKNGGKLEDEITLYIVHGFLHLLGFDDISKEDAKKMRKQEKKWMDLLAKKNLGITIRET